MFVEGSPYRCEERPSQPAGQSSWSGGGESCSEADACEATPFTLRPTAADGVISGKLGQSRVISDSLGHLGLSRAISDLPPDGVAGSVEGGDGGADVLERHEGKVEAC